MPVELATRPLSARKHEMMTDMKAAFTCALLIAPVSPQSVSALHKCRISVIDSEGAVLGKAHLFIHRDPSATETVPDRTLDADADGKLELALPDGFYDVCAMSPEFTPECRKLVVRKHDIALKFRLSPSLEVLEQQGDKFPTK